MRYELIDTITNIFTAFGTIGAVVVALWLSYKDSKPKLKVFATIGTVFPDNEQFLWLSCINVSKQPIIVNDFVFTSNRFSKKALNLWPTSKFEISNFSSKFPCNLWYSMKAKKHFNNQFFKDSSFKKLLSSHKWLAKIQLTYFWRVIATTNICVFHGKLSKNIIEEILSYHFLT